MSRRINAHITNTDDIARMFLDLNRLQNGKHREKWHVFPTTKEELDATLNEVGINGPEHCNFAVYGYDTVIDELNYYLPSYPNLNEVNYLAVKMDGMTEQQHDIFRSVIESGRHCESMKDIINIVENMDCFDLQPAFSPQMYGEFLAEMYRDHFAGALEALEKSDDPAMRELAAHIGMFDDHLDANSYGRAVAEQENGVFTEQGLLTESGGFREVYRGPEDIPHEYRVFAYPEPPTQERPSVMDKLAAAKESVKARDDGGPSPDRPEKSHDAEL